MGMCIPAIHPLIGQARNIHHCMLNIDATNAILLIISLILQLDISPWHHEKNEVGLLLI